MIARLLLYPLLAILLITLLRYAIGIIGKAFSEFFLPPAIFQRPTNGAPESRDTTYVEGSSYKVQPAPRKAQLQYSTTCCNAFA